jgi:HEAT repeat protein
MVIRFRTLIIGVLAFSLLGCALTRVWYQQDTPDSVSRSDLNECGSIAEDPEGIAACMQARGYLSLPQSYAELLKVRSLEKAGLGADEISQRLHLGKSKVLRYLDDEYQLPETESFGRLPTEITTDMGRAAVRPLIAALSDPDPLVRRQAAEALGKISDPRAVEPLITTLSDPDPLIRRQAIQALGKIKDPRAGKPLTEILIDTDEEPYVRATAAGALGRIEQATAVNALISALYDDNWVVRSRAVRALGKIRDPRAVDPLIGALRDKDATVRGYAAQALGEFKDVRAIEPLKAALQDGSPTVRTKAARALTKITGEYFEG